MYNQVNTRIMTRFISWMVLILVLLVNTASAQTNLIQNPSFEDHDCCPNSQDMLYCSCHWYNPCNWNPDYFHTCGWGSFIPPYAIGGFQFPRTGEAYAGISSYRWTPDFREYIAQRLTEPLKQNFDYYLGFYISFNASSFALDLMGAVVVTDTFECDHVITPVQSLLSFTPQVCNPYGSVLMDTLNWVLIADTFQAAGGERFLLIGDFFPDSLNTVYPWNWPWTNKIAYYFIDDVFLYELGPTGIDEPCSPGRLPRFSVYPQPVSTACHIQDLSNTYSGKLRVDILDVSGRLCLQRTLECNAGKSEVDLSTLLPGYYLVKINYCDRIQTVKLIKE